jgi:hypothetical protein
MNLDPEAVSDDFKRFVSGGLRRRAEVATEHQQHDDAEELLERAVWLERLIREPA